MSMNSNPRPVAFVIREYHTVIRGIYLDRDQAVTAHSNLLMQALADKDTASEKSDLVEPDDITIDVVPLGMPLDRNEWSDG